MLTPRFDLGPLRALGGVDCPTPGCRANAAATGVVARQPGIPRAVLEVACPDCGASFDVWWPSVDRLLERLDEAPAREHAGIAAAWVAADPRRH